MERDDDAPSESASSRREARRARREAERAAGGETTAARPRRDDAADERPSRVGPVRYMGEVRSELRKVAWPSRREVLNYSVAVLVMTAVLSGLIFGMDWVIRNLTVQIFG